MNKVIQIMGFMIGLGMVLFPDNFSTQNPTQLAGIIIIWMNLFTHDAPLEHKGEK